MATSTTSKPETNTDESRSSEFAVLAAGVIGADPRCFDDEGLRLAVGLCCELRGMVSASEARFVAELERRHGEHEARETLRKRGKRSKRQADRRTKTAKTTAANPGVQDALSAGEISDEHADVLADVEQSHPGAADELLPKAKEQGVDRFRHTARDWSREHDGDDGASQAEAQHQARRGRVFVRPEDGMGVSMFELEPTDHSSVSHALAYWIRREQQIEKANLDDGALLARTARQRVADAFVAMAKASLDGGNAGSGPGSVTARMLVIAYYDPLTRALAGRLPDGTTLSAETVRRLGCDAAVLPAVFGSKSQPVNLGRETRTVPPALRALLTERDRGCRGCGAPAEFCHAHHIQHWSHGGPTDLDNLVLLCSRCHHLVHEAGHRVHQQPDGAFTLIGPARPNPPGHTPRQPNPSGVKASPQCHAVTPLVGGGHGPGFSEHGSGPFDDPLPGVIDSGVKVSPQCHAVTPPVGGRREPGFSGRGPGPFDDPLPGVIDSGVKASPQCHAPTPPGRGTTVDRACSDGDPRDGPDSSAAGEFNPSNGNTRPSGASPNPDRSDVAGTAIASARADLDTAANNPKLPSLGHTA